MVLSIGTDGDADYYLGHQADYYTGGSEPIGRWYMPDGQFGLKDGAQIDNEVFRTLMTGIDPTNPDPGTNVIGRPPKDPRKKRVSSYDLTFSVPKSVSVLWAISDSQMRHRVERLVDDAVRRTLQTAQAHTAFIRRGRNGTDIQPTRLFGAIFQHGDARPMDNGKGELLSDMNLHQHCVLMNLGQDDRGEWYAIHAQVIMDWKMALGATHHAELARLLEESLGCRIRTVGRNGEFEVIGVPDDVLARFSRRRTLVNETLKAYGLTSAEAPELAAAITRLSREAKPAVEDAESAQTRFDRWAREALELGFTATEVLACFNHPFSAEEEHLRDLAFDDRLKTLAKDITETEATLELSDVHRAVAAICAEHGRGADDVERIVATLIDPIPLPDDLLSWDDARFDAFVEDKIASGKLVALPSTLTDNAGRRLYTAPDLIRAERGIWQACDRHRHDTRHVIPSHAVEAFIKDLHRKAAEAPSPGEEPDLAPTEEQEHALRHATTRAGLVASLEGAAGAGKSVTLKQITALYRDILGPALGVPYRVIGCSAKWLTAKAMIKDADLADEDARAAAKWIADIGLGKETIDERTVLLVDEAGQLGDRDLYDLLKPFTDAGAKVILTGDRAQQRSVGAGPALDIVASAVGSFRLERTQRMRPQADDIIVHRDGISREEAIIRVHGLSTEQQRILVKGATHVLREEIRARFRDPHYKLSPEDVLIWGENLPPLDAVKAAASLRDNQRALASLVRGPLSEAARANALAWAADSAATISPAMVYHYLHGLPWQIAEKRASLLTIEEVDALLNGHDTAVRAAVLAWAEDDSSPVTHADELRWLEGHDRRTAEARAAEAGSTTPSPPRASAAKAAARAWARRADSARSKAEDVLHHVFGLSWPDAFKRIDGMTPNERAALLSSPFDRDYNAAEADAIAKAEDWATMPTEFVTAADVLVHVYGFTRPDAEARAAAMSPQQRRKMVDLDVHHTTVRDAGQIWARQAATDVSYAPGDPAGAMKALQAYAARGHLVWLETPEDALVAAVEAWKAYMAAIPDADDILSTPARSRKFAVVIAKSNEAVRTQNALMRNHLRERGLLGPSDTIIKTQARQRIGHRHLDVDLPIAIGEQILFTERNAALDVVNGTIGCVTHITPSARNGHAVLTVQLGSGDGTRTITFDTADYADESSGRAFIEHSYAVTAFSAQGMTTAAAFAQIDSSQKSNSVYVAMSRGKSLTKLFASVQTENNFLAAELPLRQKLHATFGERDRLRSLSRFIARGQMQSAVLDAFDPTWKAKIQTIRPEDYFRHKDIEWLALSDEDLAAVIQEMTNAHTAPLPDDSDAPVFDPDALDAPTQEWLDRYDIPPPMRSPPPPHLPLFPAKASTRADRAPLSLPTGANPDPAQAIAATLCERSRTEAPSSAASHQSTPSEALVSSPAVPLGLTLPERSNGPRAPGAPSTTLHDTPFHPSTLPLILQRPWPSPEPVSLPALPTPHASAPAPTSATPAFPSVALPNWQLVSEPLNSVRTAVSGRASISRVARHLFAARIPHLRPGGPMPRDDNPVIAPRNRRGFRTYTPVNGVGRHRYDSAQVRREMDDILSGEVDFRDLLKDNGWVPVSTNSPKVNCFWTSGPKDNLDPVNTVSIIQKSKGWLWTSKDGSRRGNILSWCSEYLGWETKGRGYIDAWLALREYLPGAEPLANQTPLTEEQRQERERIRQERTERRDAERLQAEAAHRDAVADTHTHAAEGWPKLATPAATSAGNLLERRGIARSTQNTYADTIRFDPRGQFVAFKHTAVDGSITGFERKGDGGFNKFTTGPGGKALAVFGDPNTAITRIVLTETGVDAVSAAQADGCPDDALYLSTGGNSNARLDGEWGTHFAAEHIVALARRHPTAVIELATDRDRGGNTQATGWAALLADHPGGLRRRVPSHTNDWNNQLRLPNPALLSADSYRKDLCKAAPSLPPPPTARPDLLPHWQAYEAARPHLAGVLESIARSVDAWNDQKGVIDDRKFADAPLARDLWNAIHTGISADTPLPAAIDAAVSAILPAWHAWYAQADAYSRLAEQLGRTLAWDPERERVDRVRLARGGATDYLTAIRAEILAQALPLDRAIAAAVAAIDAQDGAALKASRSGRGEPPPDRTAARDALLRLRAHMVAHPDDVTLPPASVPLHPTLASLSAMAQRLAATPAPLPDPATWRPTEPAHDPVADARAAAQTAATSATTEDPASRPFAVPATTVGASPGPAVSPASQSSPSPSSPASSDAAPDTPTIAPAALPPALAAVHAARQAWDAADQRAPAGDHIPEDSAERQAQHAARRAGHTDADIAAAALNIPLAAYSIAAGLPAWGGRPGLLLPAEDNNDLVALQQAILSHRAADRAAAFADDRTAARYKLEGAQRAENRAWARAHLAGHSEAVIRAAVAAITHPSQRRPAEPLDTDALSAAGTMPPLDAMADDAPSAHTQGIDDDARAMPSFDDEDRPPTEDEIALDLARRLTQDDAAADMVRDIDDLLITTDHEDDAIMDTLTPSPLSAADILVAGQREAADRAAELQAASTAATRARADSDARRLRAEDAHNRREGIASDTTVRPPKTTASGPGKDTALGEEFGVDHAPEKQRHAFLKDLGEFYRTHFAAKHEQEIAHVRIRPGQYADDVKVEFRDGSYIRDDGRSIMLDSKGTPQKAELLIEIAAAKGMSSVRLKGSREFKMDLAKACYEHGIEVLNPELQDYMRLLADRFPERAGIHARESNFEDPHAATNQRATTPPDNPPPAADPSPTSPAPSGPLPSPASATATPEAGPGAATPTLATDPLAKRLIDLTAARVARAEASLAALSASLDQPAVDAATEALAAARAALTKAERIAAIRAGTLHDDPIITAALAEDDALRLWIADEVTLATDRANATPPATAPRIARSHPLATLAVALADEGVTRAAAVLSDAEDAGPTQAAVDAARADLARATNARDTIREIATTSPAAALLAATRTVIDAEIATLAPLVTSANDDTEARRIDALRGVTDADILTAAAAMTNPPEAALGKSLAATLSDAALAAAHERWSQDDAAAPTTPPVPESTSATPQTGTDPLPPDPQVIASLVSANLQDIDRTAFTSMSWSDFSDERRDTESSAWDLQTAIVDALRANGLPATDASVQATYEAFRAPADQTPPITAPQPTAASPVGDADAAAQSAISVASSPALMPPDPVADLHSALATLATPQAPEVVRAHAAMSAAEARTQIEAALFAAQTDAAITAATPPALARLDATLLEAFDTVAIGRQWLSMTAARYGNAPAALTAALRFDPNGAINGVAEPETTAFLSRLADTIDADPAALQAQQPPALDPAGVAREERIASLSIALAEAPGHDALRTAELKHLATVDLDYGIHDAPTEAYAARVTPVVAALQATSLLDWTIDAHLPGYRDAGLARQTLLANGLPFLDGPARADIQAAAEAAGRANRALLAADSTITPDHLRQGADQRIATADGIVAALIMAPAPLPRPTDPTAVAIHATARAFLAAATSAQRALAAATLLDLLVETRPTVASLETSLLAPLAAAEREERNAASDLKFRAVNLRDAVTALYADPAAVLAALDATPAAARAAWIATPPAVADLGPRLTVDETAPHADHHASQFAEAHAIFPDAVRACAQASVAHAAAAHAATQARAAVAETPNAPAAQEIRAAIRDAIPWSSLPSASGTTTSDVRLSVVGTTTDLDAAAAVLYHAAAPASHSLSAADLARDPTLSPADRDTLVTWLHLDDTLSQASEAQTAARSPTAAPAVRLQALTTAENAILEVAIATQQLGATPTNRAFHVALGDFQAAAHALAHQAARLIQADPASLQHALAHGAEYSLTTHRAPDAPPQSDHRSPEHDQAADAVEPEMA